MILGAIAAGVTAALLPRYYVSAAILTVPAGFTSGQLHTVLTKVLNVEGLSNLVREHRLYESESNMEVRIHRLKQSLRIQQVVPLPTGSGGFQVATEHRDQATAQRVTRAVVALIRQQTNAEVLDPPSLPRAPIFPNPTPIVVIGCLAGLMIGLFTWLLLRRPRPQPAV
jgi:uncharacterized protein involved in exopolysaccharide biosynthesis